MSTVSHIPHVMRSSLSARSAQQLQLHCSHCARRMDSCQVQQCHGEASIRQQRFDELPPECMHAGACRQQPGHVCEQVTVLLQPARQQRAAYQHLQRVQFRPRLQHLRGSGARSGWRGGEEGRGERTGPRKHMTTSTMEGCMRGLALGWQRCRVAAPREVPPRTCRSVASPTMHPHTPPRPRTVSISRSSASSTRRLPRLPLRVWEWECCFQSAPCPLVGVPGPPSVGRGVSAGHSTDLM